MPATNISAQRLSSMQKFILTFNSVTSIKLFFYSMGQEIVTNKQILWHAQDVLNYLTGVNIPQAAIYPVILDGSLFGFFVLDAVNSSPEQNRIFQSYLARSSHQFKENNKDNSLDSILILKAVKVQQVQRWANGLGLISNIQESVMPAARENLKQKHDYAKISHKTNNYLRRAVSYINENLNQPLTLDEVAQQVYLSPSYLSRIFKNSFKVNFIDYINLQKIALAQAAMLKEHVSVTALAKQLGFSQVSYFSKIFKKESGLTPSKYRQKSKNFKKIYTITRRLDWLNNPSVFQASQTFFASHQVSFQYQALNDYPFVYAIDGLGNEKRNYGWIYTVDCKQPVVPPNRITAGQTSVIQWIYTKNTF